MEDDDEFGDLYTDVLRPFASSSSSSIALQHQQPPQAFSAAPPPPVLHHRPIDFNIQRDDAAIAGGASQSSHPNVPSRPPPTGQTLVSFPSPADISIQLSGEADSGARVLEPGGAELREGASEGAVAAADDDGFRRQQRKVEEFMHEDVNFDIEEGSTGAFGIGVGDDDEADSEPVIPGLKSSSVPVRGSAGDAENVGTSRRDGDDDWDSDSEDDLKIVLNDNNHGPMAMERGGMAVGGDDEDDDDEDEDGLVIVTDGDPNQSLEEQEWGEDGMQPPDGERKETGEGSGKAGASIAAAQKIGYSNYGYHQYHSQFKVSDFCILGFCFPLF